jgi:hypothetical protein
VRKLANFIEKTIVVCIPGFTKDDRLYPYKLVGVEADGLWLESPAFRRGLEPPPAGPEYEELAAFVPFAQILYALCDAVIDPDTNRRVLVSHNLHEAPGDSEGSESYLKTKRNLKKGKKRL